MPMIRVVAVSMALLATACSGSSTNADQAGVDDTATGGDGTASDDAESSATADETASSADEPTTDETASNADEPTTDSEPGWPHDFQGSLLSGGQFDANDLAGSDLVLWFWAPW